MPAENDACFQEPDFLPRSEFDRLNQCLLSMKELVEQASRKQKTLCSCESFTAGLFSALAGSISGASKVLKGGFVTYFTEMKIKAAGVDPNLIDTYGVVSAECAKAMAENTRAVFDADFCVSFTGNAGPSSMENKPAGLVYCALAEKGAACEVFEWQIDLERNALRLEACRRMIAAVQSRLNSCTQ